MRLLLLGEIVFHGSFVTDVSIVVTEHVDVPLRGDFESPEVRFKSRVGEKGRCCYTHSSVRMCGHLSPHLQTSSTTRVSRAEKKPAGSVAVLAIN